jgi:hypothetical protein
MFNCRGNIDHKHLAETGFICGKNTHNSCCALLEIKDMSNKSIEGTVLNLPRRN